MNSNQQKLKNKQYQHSYDWKSQFNPKWITDKIDRDAIDFADKFGKYLKDNFLSSSQLRNIFGEMKMLQMKLNAKEESFDTITKRFLLLLPKLSYSAGRLRTRALNEFKEIFDIAHKAVDINSLENFKKHYNNFVDFIEAILAYHRSHGGK